MECGQVDLAIIGGEVPAELQESLDILPYAEDEFALILPSNHSFVGMKNIPKEDIYKLQFISLDAQSTIRKAIDRVLTRCGIDPNRLKIEMELNSIEAIKNAVQAGLGAAFVSAAAIEREVENGTLHRAYIDGVAIDRILSVIVNPNRYRSKAAEAFAQEILPNFTTYAWDAGKLFSKRVKAEIDIEEDS
jgi:DNA-binding transcriptional LysR family regulator